MDFERVLGTLLDGFESRGIRCALMGGFAMGALGVPRATLDVDFLVHQDDLPKLGELMMSLGYRKHYGSENVSQYEHPDDRWGAVDFIHAFREISLGMLQRARLLPAFSGKRTLRVLEPEDVIGLKVQALANNPKRLSRETADIEALLRAHRGKLDTARLEEYFQLFGLSPLLASLRERCDAD